MEEHELLERDAEAPAGLLDRQRTDYHGYLSWHQARMLQSLGPNDAAETQNFARDRGEQ